MSFNVSYSAGGVIDEVKKVKAILGGVIDQLDNVGNVENIDNVNEIAKILLLESVNRINTIENVLSVSKVEVVDKVTEIDTLKEIENLETVENVLSVSKVEAVDKVTEIDTLKEIQNLETVGAVNKVLTVEEVKKVHGLPEFFKPYNTMLKLEVPAMDGVYECSYTTQEDIELLALTVTCSGYHDKDYYDIICEDQISQEVWFEKWYCSEVKEGLYLGTSNNVYKVPKGNTITLKFHNQSGTSKFVWFGIRMLVE